LELEPVSSIGQSVVGEKVITNRIITTIIKYELGQNI
jgi:hypothetical protein